MADSNFQVVFDGQVADGADPAAVKAGLAKLFKMDVSKVEPLFSGRRAVVKRGLDEATARKYVQAFEQVGAIAAVVDGAQPEAPPPAPAESPAAEPAAAEPEPSTPGAGEDQEPTRTEIAEAGRAPPPLVARGTPTAPDDMSMADPGAMLVDGPSNVETPDIDTSHLSLSEAGVDLTERKKVEAPEFDLSALELAPPGTPLGEP